VTGSQGFSKGEIHWKVYIGEQGKASEFGVLNYLHSKDVGMYFVSSNGSLSGGKYLLNKSRAHADFVCSAGHTILTVVRSPFKILQVQASSLSVFHTEALGSLTFTFRVKGQWSL
jgi:hypothetical protein